MNRMLNHRQDEQGFVLVVAMMMLVVLTFIGIAATNTTVFELQIAGNERQAAQEFNVADSGWKMAAPFLNDFTHPPGRATTIIADTPPETVRHFGEDDPDFPNSTEDGALNYISYRYRVVYLDHEAAIGSGAGFIRFNYEVTSVAAERAEVEVIISRIFGRVGY